MKKRIQRILISWYSISDNPLPKWLQRACDKDIGLQLDLEEERRLTQALKSEYEEPVEELDDGFARAVFNELDEKPTPLPEAGPWKEIAIGVAACVAIALALQWKGGPFETENGDLVHETSLESRDISQVLSLAEIDWKNPLDEEMENVLADAQGAVDFLTESFLPSSVTLPPGPRG